MPSSAQITVHWSQFPEQVRRQLVDSLRARRINSKFHYDSLKQAQKWLQVHQAFSPSRTDPDCEAIYEASFQTTSELIGSHPVHVIGLGCGGGRKDTHLAAILGDKVQVMRYSPCDVGVAMVLTARNTALQALPQLDVRPIVCDLASANDLGEWFNEQGPADAIRVITFFGMIPNFEPELILPKLAALLRPQDLLLFSANLVPQPAHTGIQRVLPQYDNALTLDWLMTFLLDLGIESGDGELRVSVDEHGAIKGLQRITARFAFSKARSIQLDHETFSFVPGDTLLLFYSYRYTPEIATALLSQHGIVVQSQFITRSREEAVFVCRGKGNSQAV